MKTKLYYIENEKKVFTEEYHIKRGHCCGSGCRHCPYWPKYQKGNTSIRPENKLPRKDIFS